MKLQKLILFFTLVSLFSVRSFGQQDPSRWSFEAKKLQGNKYKILIQVSLEKDWHVWSLTPGGDGSLVPVSFKFNKNADVKLIGKPTEKGKVISEDLDGDGTKENYLENKVEYTQEAEISANTKVTGTYTYQTCNHSLCLRGKTMSFSILVTDAGGGVIDTVSKTSANNGDTSLHPAATTIATDTSNTKAAVVAPVLNEHKDEMSLWALFFICLGGGLLALLTPCVYSMIPITVSFFTKRSKTKNEGIRNAIYYALSIILIFTILGVIISVVFWPYRFI